MVYSIKPDYVGLTLHVVAEPKCAQNCAQCVGLKPVTHTGWLSSFWRDLRSIRRQDAELIGQDEVIEVRYQSSFNVGLAYITSSLCLRRPRPLSVSIWKQAISQFRV